MAVRTESHAPVASPRLAVARLDLTGVLVEANDDLCRLVGSAPEQLVGRALHRIATFSTYRVWEEQLAAARNGERTGQLRVDWCGAESSIPLALTWILEQDAEHRPTWLTAVLHPIAPVTGTTTAAAELPEAGAVAVEPRAPRRGLGARRRRVQLDFYESMSRRSSDLAIVLDPLGQIVYASPSVSGMLAYDLIDVVGAEAWRFVHPEDRAAAVAAVRAVDSGGGALTRFRIRRRDGAWRWVEGAVSNMFDTAVGGMVFNLRDVTDRLRAERALSASDALHRAIADRSTEGMWVVHPDGRTLYANDRLSEILGVAPDELDPPLLGGLLGEVPIQLRADSAAGEEVARVRHETTYLHPNGTELVLTIALTTIEHAEVADRPAYLLLLADVTRARRLEDELRRSALRDQLTGLPNQALLLDRLELALTRTRAGTAVIALDLDGFRHVNDACGHRVGDDLLVAVAERLQENVPQTDTVARFGADTFVIVCEPADEARALGVVTALSAAMRAPFHIQGHELHVTASAGVAVSPAESAHQLLSSASAAMHAAKAAGRGTVLVSDPQLSDRAKEAFELGSDLWRALSQDSLRLHYQPVVDLGTGAVVGVEALARWDHPTLGPIEPSRFVAIAERTGMAPELDRWAVRTALRDVRQMRDRGVLDRRAYVAINLSARSLSAPGMEAYIAATARTLGICPAGIVLEVTEGSVMSDPEAARAMLGRLREQGFQIALDDFGTGHSSLAYLRTLPITTLKIDRSFVAGIADNHQDLAIAKMVVELARAVGLSVVAEGVETVAHARLLTAMGCTSGQGWLWSRAISPKEARVSRVLVRGYAGLHRPRAAAATATA
nr:EAL domain-containing protein [Nocardioides ochotonae]